MTSLILAYLIIGLVSTLGWVVMDDELREDFELTRPEGPNYPRSFFCFLLFTLIWPLSLWIFVQQRFFQAPNQKPQPQEDAVFKVTQSDLVAPYSIDEIETQALIRDPLGAVPDKPFGHLNAVWLEFKAGLSDDARLWSFGAQWRKNGSRIETIEGYVLSDGKTIGKHFVVRRRRM